MRAASPDQAAHCAAGGTGSGFACFMPARSSAEPAPHFEMTLTARGVRADSEQLRLFKRLAQQLQADRQSFPFRLRKAAWNGDAAVPREIGGDGEDVREIHPHRVVATLAEFERDLG